MLEDPFATATVVAVCASAIATVISVCIAWRVSRAGPHISYIARPLILTDPDLNSLSKGTKVYGRLLFMNAGDRAGALIDVDVVSPYFPGVQLRVDRASLPKVIRAYTAYSLDIYLVSDGPFELLENEKVEFKFVYEITTKNEIQRKPGCVEARAVGPPYDENFLSRGPIDLGSQEKIGQSSSTT